MGTPLKILITVINYSHDIATAMLGITSICMYFIYRYYRNAETPESIRSFLLLYSRLTRLAIVSLIWLLLAGVPRVIFYREMEWSVQAGSVQIYAIGIKHLFMFFLVGTGVLHWRRLSSKVRELKRGLQ